MKVKRKDLHQFLQGLQECGKYGDIQFAYAIVKNKKTIKDELAIVEELAKPSDKFNAYESKRIDLIMKLADKDEKGQVITRGNNAQIIEHQKEFEEQLNVLMQEHKEALDERTNQIQKANDFMDAECDLEFYKLSVDKLPKDLNADSLEKIMFMVDDAK